MKELGAMASLQVSSVRPLVSDRSLLGNSTRLIHYAACLRQCWCTAAFTDKRPSAVSVLGASSRRLFSAVQPSLPYSVQCSSSSCSWQKSCTAYHLSPSSVQHAYAVGIVHLTLQQQTQNSSISRTALACAAAGEAGDTADHLHNSSSSSSSAKPGGVLGVLSQWNQDTKKLRQQLQSLGLAGVVAYGLFNTAYYTVAFLFVWFTVVNVPAGLGWQASSRKAAEVFALVWAGSQVTKLLRAGGALAFAPVVDQGLDWAVGRFHMKSKQQAFVLVVLACCLLATLVFGCVVAMHA